MDIKKDDVFLLNLYDRPSEKVVRRVTENMVDIEGWAWVTREGFEKMAIEKIGVVRRIIGIPCGIRYFHP